MLVFLFNTLIYVFLLYVYVSSSRQLALFGYPDCVFLPCFFLSCKANARVKPAETGHGQHPFKILYCSMYCLFCVVLCIVCV